MDCHVVSDKHRIYEWQAYICVLKLQDWSRETWHGWYITWAGKTTTNYPLHSMKPLKYWNSGYFSSIKYNKSSMSNMMELQSVTTKVKPKWDLNNYSKGIHHVWQFIFSFSSIKDVSHVLITFITNKCYHFTGINVDHEMEHWK